MDLNTKIIEGVKQFPTLYDDKGNLDERNQAWMQLADKLKMHEVYLKIRWHSLMQAYQRNMNFKYANNMDFVPRIKETHNKGENWPEFIITEEDLKEDRSVQEQEEFVFLEIDEEDAKVKEMPKATVKEKTVENVKQLEEASNVVLENKDFEQNVYKIKNIEKLNELKATQNVEVKENIEDKPKECDKSTTTTTKVEEKMTAVDVNKKENDQVIKETKEVAIEKSHIKNERCEDAIFGELVSATLRHVIVVHHCRNMHNIASLGSTDFCLQANGRTATFFLQNHDILVCDAILNSDEDIAFSTTQELIIRTRLEMEPDFQEGRKNRTILWENVLSKIKETQPDFKMTKDQISRKFLNLMTTYRRIKDRSNVIFGELVSAMLKRMDENRKKDAKKEIMNILCS
ncbi:hypothetical protein CVS40_2849 [Lucilia cuprina]|nr:hypothetical protein CVS40_2849 [Lucilia cuprina]